ncbi:MULTISPECIES: MFS transporter [Bacillus]|uniref:MFS transporter n=1 Tax=Bacillus TaxID=1386 RepID=UPI002243EE23|nr:MULTISPECIES: MFS transporter [Bacillus]MDN5386842.1 MFS transporter [Bacillus sp. LB7]MEC1021124.1 MFS transporter [Bacillus paralicheniformis]MEC1027124.1 MFS transporter [Bacillus paralicheniformis]MEC1033286.1 MFS transporter [Bacillus paralicheniformis]MEC1051012.1 MFS transporter [Bacillus paralicheniformis]
MERQKQIVYEEKQILKKDHIIFWGAVFCFWFATYIYVPVFGLYLDNIGFSYSAIGIVLGSYGVTQILLRFPFGILSDVLSPLRKQLLISGFAMSLLSCCIFLLFDSFIMVITARLLAGMTAAMWVMATVLYSQYFTKDQSSKAMGILQFLTVLPQFVSMAVSGYLVHLFGWMFPFWIGVAVSCIGLILSFYIKDNGPRHTAKGMALSDYVKQTLRLPDLKVITTLSFLAHAVLFMTVFGFTPIYAESVGIDEKQLIWIMCAFFIPQTLASVWCIFYKVKAADALIWISYVITAVFFSLLPFAETLFAVCVIHAVTGLTLGFIFPLLVSKVAQLGTPQLKMSVMGFYQSFYALGFFLGPVVAGKTAELFGLREVFWFAGALSLAGAGVMLVSKQFSIRTKSRRG